jgi:hypothetical protein
MSTETVRIYGSAVVSPKSNQGYNACIIGNIAIPGMVITPNVIGSSVSLSVACSVNVNDSSVGFLENSCSFLDERYGIELCRQLAARR